MDADLTLGSTQDWDRFIERLYRQNQFAIKLGLDNIRRALSFENNPQHNIPAIIIAGTNGKGSTAAYLSGILQSHGLRVGLYTSPHLISLEERFRVDGQVLSRETVFPIGKYVLERYGDTDDQEPRLTFFELTTLMAALLFKQQDVGVAIYEVGLGGRLDAVNAIEPALSIITTIGYDHQAYLGHSIDKIATEKKGVIRQNTPFVLGFQHYSEAIDTILTAENRSYARVFGEDFDASYFQARFVNHAQTACFNMSTAFEAAKLYLQDSLWCEHTALVGIESTRWPGRTQWIVEPGSGVQILFDAAHNPAGVESLMHYIKSGEYRFDAIIFGAMSDKDIVGLVKDVELLNCPIIGCVVDSPRAASQEQLSMHLTGHVFCGAGSCDWAMTKALSISASQEERVGKILVFGSIYLLGECMRWLGLTSEDMMTYINE